MVERAETLGEVATEELIASDTPSHSGRYALPVLLRFVDFIVDPSRRVNFEHVRPENVRHLPLLSDGKLFSVRRDVRSRASENHRVAKVFNRSISPASVQPPTGVEFRRLLREIHLLTSPGVRESDNIVRLDFVSFGIFSFNPLELSPVLKLPEAEFGDLGSFQSTVKTLEFEHRLHLCADITAGLFALHEADYVHGSLDASHVLIFKHAEREYTAKLCGFGNSFAAEDFASYIGGPADPWKAPEVNEGCVKLSDVLMSDVFPLGLLFWQVLVHASPFDALDLPLDEEAKKTELLETLRLPYLYRFLPLIVDHELGATMNEEIIGFMSDLFATTIRLNPAKRSLVKAMEILELRTGRKLDGSKQDSALERKEPPNPLLDIDMEKLGSEDLHISAESMAMLPWDVQSQLLQSLESCEPSFDKSTGALAQKSAVELLWLRFICHFHGLGCEKDPKAAKTCLRSLSELKHRLSTDLLEIVSESADKQTESAVAANGWIQHLNMHIKDPKSHGITVDREALQLIIRMQSQNDEKISGNNTVLHGASFFGLLEEASILLERSDAELNAQNENGDTPLLLACQAGHTEIAQLLLQKGADASIINVYEENCLHWLTSFPDESKELMVDLLLEADVGSRLLLRATSNRVANKWATVCPDLKAFEEGRLQGGPVLRSILQRDKLATDLNLDILLAYASRAARPSGWPTEVFVKMEVIFEDPLQLACELHLFDMLEFLLAKLRRALAEIPTPEGVTALVKATKEQNMLGEFHFFNTKSTTFMRSAISCGFDIMRLYYHGSQHFAAQTRTLQVLKQYGFLLEVVESRYGYVGPLNFAIMSRNKEAVRFLLEDDEIGLTLNRADCAHQTAVHEAIDCHQYEILELLAASGATIDLRQQSDPEHSLSGVGASYMHVLGSSRITDKRYPELLLKHGVPASIKDKRGVDAVSMALIRACFPLAQTLIEHGASLVDEGPYGVTFLGQLFLPHQAVQCDDLLATVRFLLSYDGQDGNDLFIVNQQVGYSAFHVAAAQPTDDPIFGEMLDVVLEHYSDPAQIDARAKTPAQSTALQMAIFALNDVAVEHLLNAGADYNIVDLKGRTCLDIAQNGVESLIHKSAEQSVSYSARVGKALNILRLLAEKSGWPGPLDGFKDLFKELEGAAPLVDIMRKSIHQVSYMRHLENESLRAVARGTHRILAGQNTDLAILSLMKNVIDARSRSALRVDLDFRVLGDVSAANPSSSYAAARKAIPWSRGLSDSRLQDYQSSASFEWFLDQELQKLESGEPKESGFMRDFALSRDQKDFSLPPEIVRYPKTLLEYYRWMISSRDLDLEPESLAMLQRFVRILMEREQALQQKSFPIPKFDEEFRKFHFESIQPAELHFDTALATVLLVTRCRCFSQDIGIVSRYSLQRVSQRSSGVDESIWRHRLSKFRREIRDNCTKRSTWLSEFGITLQKTTSTLQYVLLEIETDLELIAALFKQSSALEAAELLGESPKTPDESTKAPTPWPKSQFEYQPLDLDNIEVRLLTLLPPSDLTAEDLVSCTMEHVSLLDVSASYESYLQSVSQGTSQSTLQRQWEKYARKTSQRVERFVWGDFSALSYTWGTPSAMKKIIVNDVEILVGANLEAALRVLRQQPDFARGLKLWVDALCINQADMAEKSKVLMLMQQLYQVSQKVTVWVGDEASHKRPLPILRSFLQECNIPGLYDADEEVSSEPALTLTGTLEMKDIHPPPVDFIIHVFPALVDLMSSPYWMRLWIMQELTNSSHQKMIHLGGDTMDWTELGHLFSLYCTKLHHGPEYVSDDFDRNVAIETGTKMRHILQLHLQDQVHAWNLNLTFLSESEYLRLASTANVSDERDRVYGMLGLLSPDIAQRIKPDYTKSVAEVFIDLSMAIVQATGTFDELFLGSDAEPLEGLPSWAINLRNRHQLPSRNNRAGGPALASGARMGPTDSPETANELEREVESRPRFRCGGRVLTLRAIRVDVVTLPPRDEANPNEPMCRYGAAPETDSHADISALRTALARVLLADCLLEAPLEPRNATQPDESGSGSRRFRDAGEKTSLFTIPWFPGKTPDPVLDEELSRAGWGPVLATPDFALFQRQRLAHAAFPLWDGRHLEDFFPVSGSALGESGYGSDRHVAAVMEDLGRAQGMAGRELFQTRKRGLLGSAAGDFRERDVVFVVRGCSFPVIVREVARPEGLGTKDDEEDGKEEGGKWFEVVGECYVEGVMESEAVEWARKGEVDLETINLI